MNTGYEPLTEVRKSFKVDWYRCPIPPETLKDLTARSDLKGALQSFGFLALITFTASVSLYCFANRIWIGLAAALFVHGTIFTFVPGLVTHEFSHGTVFATKWLNAFFLRLYSLLGWVNFHHYKRSHTFHHLYTLHPRGDREVILPANPSIKPIRLLWLFTFNVPRLLLVLRTTVRLAFARKFHNEWSEAIFPESDPAGRRKAANWALVILGFHAAVLTVSIVFGLWLLPVVVTFAMFIANWWGFFIGMTMHAGLKDDVPDFRLCCRTIKLDPFSRFIYWYMNYHTEHHMFAAVPCYNLGKLQRAIAWDMPEPRTLTSAWREMLDTYRRQKIEPGYQFETPLPDRMQGPDAGGDALGASLGDLAPKEME